MCDPLGHNEDIVRAGRYGDGHRRAQEVDQHGFRHFRSPYNDLSRVAVVAAVAVFWAGYSRGPPLSCFWPANDKIKTQRIDLDETKIPRPCDPMETVALRWKLKPFEIH